MSCDNNPACCSDLATERLINWKAERERRIKAEKERDEAVTELQARIEFGIATERPLTPDAITDQIVDYVHEDYFWSTSDRVRLEKPALKHALLDAVKRLAEPPTRPEGAEEMADDMEDCLRDVKLEDVGLDGLADHLTAMGYRKEQNR